MGINPDRVNMLTFGLGSGIAGIAGVAIGGDSVLANYLIENLNLNLAISSKLM